MTEASANRAFRVAVVLVLGGLSVAVLALSLLATTSGPRIRHAAVQSLGTDGEASSVGQGVTFVFDRAVKSADFDGAVEVRPEARHAVSHRDGQLSVVFEENLRADTTYEITVKPEGIEDASGKEMDEPYGYEFDTAAPSFTFLERNPDSGEPDQIVERWPLSGESRTLYEAERIEAFERGGDRLAVVNPRGADASDELRTISLSGGDEARVPLPGNVKVADMSLSPTGAQLAFVIRANVGREADVAYREGYDGRLYRYDTASGRLQRVETPGDSGKFESVLFSRDGGALLYRTLDGAYYLTSAAGGTRAETIPLGKYDGTGGFDSTGTRVSFQNRDGGAIYDARTGRLQELPGVGTDRGSSTPTFANNSEAIVYRQSVRDADADAVASIVVVVNERGEEVARVDSTPETYFFDEPVLSPDDRYALIETASDSADIDDYLSNPQPKGARIGLYDLSSDEILDEVRGVDPVWNQ